MGDIFSRFEGDEHWQELLEEFVAHMTQRIAALDKAIATNDVASLSILAHQLKGACGSYGFDQITPLADRLEKALKEGPWTGGVPRELAIFIDALQRITHRSPLAAHDCGV